LPIPVPEHPVPAGPLAVRYLTYDVPPLKAGTEAIATVELENAGTATWWSHGPARIRLSYHWLDRLGNPIVWDGERTPLPAPVAPGERVQAWLRVAVPIPPGAYRFAVDLLDEGLSWLAELGNRVLTVEVDVRPRIDRRALAVSVGEGAAELRAATRAALAAQEEPLVETDASARAFLAAGCVPARDWSRLVLDAHEEGYAAVAGSVEVEGGPLARRAFARQLAPWAPGFGRSPGWKHALLCPSLVAEAVDSPAWTEPVAGLPALDPAGLGAPWLCDGRIRVAVPARALRQGDRRRA